jgi:hypothetical protein
MEVTVNKQQFRKLATVGAAAALSLQLLAGVASAAVPNATSGGFTYGSFAGDGWAGFSLSYDYSDSSTLAKLYLKIEIAGGEAIQTFDITKNGSNVNGCSTSATLITCQIKTVRAGDHFDVLLVVQPTVDASEVRLRDGWSSTGYVEGGNNSHGDAWDLCQSGQAGCDVDTDAATLNELVSSRTGDANTAAGFGNTSLNTSTTNLGGNGQAASLKNLPNGKYAFVNDNAGDAPDSDYPFIELSVNGGAPATFQVLIVYPKGTSAPKYFEHVSTGYATVNYYACAKNAPKLNCFDWSNQNNTVTMYPAHNGTLRRSG